MKPLSVHLLGRRSYRDVWEIQRDAQAGLISGQEDEALFLCEHDPVITIGRSGNNSNILASPEILQKRGIEVIEVERGGDVTYHGPGQLVGYPILNLNRHKRDVGWYMRSLEEVIIRTLSESEIKAGRYCGRTGVWTGISENAIDSKPLEALSASKIASIGVRLSRWCTLHGFALNVRDCSEGFGYIHPCGYADIKVTSVEQELSSKFGADSTWVRIQAAVLRNFCEVFEFTINNRNIE